MPEQNATIGTETMPGIGSSELLARAERWESAGKSAKQAAPDSAGALLVDGFVAGLRGAAAYARDLEETIQAAMNSKPSDLGDWKRETRRKFQRLARANADLSASARDKSKP